jgi:hypothetical protein
MGAGNAWRRATCANCPKAWANGAPWPSLRQHSLRWTGRSPDGPPADPGGNAAMALRAALVHSASRASPSPSKATLLATSAGRSAPKTRCGWPCGCNSVKACRTPGSVESANPAERSSFVAFESAPSSMRARIFPTWDAGSSPSSSRRACCRVRTGFGATLLDCSCASRHRSAS